MTIKEIYNQLETAQHPVARALHKGTNFKVLAIGFKKGMIMKEHQAHLPAKLTVFSGKVQYIENERIITLSQFEEVDIPVEVIHSVEAVEDSLCLLTQG